VFPGLDIVFTSAKHRAHFGLLVDDRVQTVVKCKDRAVLFTQPWNVRVKTDVSRVSSHSEVLKLVEGL
jgi:5'(3')-deoxyribonucleotidase